MPTHHQEFRRGSLFEQMAGALKWLDDGDVFVQGIYETAAPSDATEVYRRLSRRESEKLTCVFEW